VKKYNEPQNLGVTCYNVMWKKIRKIYHAFDKYSKKKSIKKQ